MHLYLVAVSKRPPAWLATGQSEYLRRLPRQIAPRVIEVEPVAGARRDTAAVLAEEAARVRQVLPREVRLIVLDERGEDWTSAVLAARLGQWHRDGADVALVIGGPDGVDPDLKREAAALWSLSRLTLPHQLARVLVAEQLYRAWSLQQNHPYHRD
jgi:23S rRNA (pseudouridine1915-N3)-methyltransferase